MALLPIFEGGKLTPDPELELAQAICDDLLAADEKWQSARAVAESQGITKLHVTINSGEKAAAKYEIDCRPVKMRTTKTGFARRMPDSSIVFNMVEEHRGT